MLVHVRLHFLPNFCGGRETADVELPEGADVKSLLAALGIPAGIAGVVLVDAKQAATADTLTDGASTDIYPVVAGG